MPTNDLSSKKGLLLNYFKELAKERFPDADTSDHSAFMEMFGTPHLEMLMPLLDFADRVKLTQSIENANLMTEEEMDELATNYFVTRNPGSSSVGYVNILFDDIPANNAIQIPAGTEAVSKQGLRFRSVETVLLNEQTLADYYDTDTFRYKIPVLFQSEYPGTQYNVDENEITELNTALAHFDRAYNPLPFSGGVDYESNMAFADRIKETTQSPNLGVERGWIEFIHSFSPVEDVIVAGFGHPLMMRDQLGLQPGGDKLPETMKNRHWGGKIDLHIRGKQLNTFVETIKLRRDERGDLSVTLNKKPIYDIVEIQFTSPRYTNPDLDESFFVVRDFFLLKKDDPEKIGTLQEESWVVIVDDRLEEDDIVTVRYRYNTLLETIETSIYREDNRPPGSDVMLKEARRKFVHSGLIVGMSSPSGLREQDKSSIRQRLHNWFTEHGTGKELQFSDLTAPIKDFSESTLETHVDYIDLPSKHIVTDHNNRLLYYCLSQKKREFLDSLMAESVYFSEWLPRYKDLVTIYDFFDTMHILTYQNIEQDALRSLSNRNNEWGSRVYFFKMAQRMMNYVNSVQRLSPAKWKTQQNEFFELGYLAIYEDEGYSESEVENYLQLFQNISESYGSQYEDHHMLHLTVYFSVILYIMNVDNIGGFDQESLFNWMIDLTRGTPIDYQVHH